VNVRSVAPRRHSGRGDHSEFIRRSRMEARFSFSYFPTISEREEIHRPGGSWREKEDPKER
jgi:hypothetical protein